MKKLVSRSKENNFSTANWKTKNILELLNEKLSVTFDNSSAGKDEFQAGIIWRYLKTRNQWKITFILKKCHFKYPLGWNTKFWKYIYK